MITLIREHNRVNQTLLITLIIIPAKKKKNEGERYST